MELTNPVYYREHDKLYYSDTCLPLVKAWNAGKLELEAWARHSYPCTYRMTSDVLPGLSTVGYWDARYEQDWGLDWHRNEGIEITFLETGSMPFYLGNEAYMLKPDELTITRPWQPHKLGNPQVGIGKLYWIILDVNVRHPHQAWNWPSWTMLTRKDLEELTRMLRQNEQPVWKGDTEIRKCFQKIGQLVSREKEAVNESWLTICINELLMYFLEFFRRGSIEWDAGLTDSIRTVELFIQELHDSFFEPWTLDSMAAHCGLGVTRFVHYFRQLRNTTPMHYLTYIRLEAAARHLLSKPEKSINKIGYDCGFSSGQYFSTVFRKRFGCSPAAYRTRYSLKCS